MNPQVVQFALPISVLLIVIQNQWGNVIAARTRISQTERENGFFPSLRQFQIEGDACKRLSDTSTERDYQAAEFACLTAIQGYNGLPDWAKPRWCRNGRDGGCYRKSGHKYRCAFHVDPVNKMFNCVRQVGFKRLKYCIAHLDLNPPSSGSADRDYTYTRTRSNRGR